MTTLEKNARMTEKDIAVLKAMFEDREGAVEVIRKIFYPELTADAPIRINQDMWSSCMLTPEMTPEQKVIAVEAHQKLLQHIEGSLGVIKTLVGKKDESPEQVLNRLQKDSAR
jgi:hypothetical protein